MPTLNQSELANKVFNIPDDLLWGRQERYEYNLSHGNRIKKKLKSEGVSYLHKNPITCCPLEINDGQYTLLVIIDGHHRIRFAPTAGIMTIPAFIKTLEEIAELEKKPVHCVEKELHEQMGLALKCFYEQTAYKDKKLREKKWLCSSLMEFLAAAAFCPDCAAVSFLSRFGIQPVERVAAMEMATAAAV